MVMYFLEENNGVFSTLKSTKLEDMKSFQFDTVEQLVDWFRQNNMYLYWGSADLLSWNVIQQLLEIYEFSFQDFILPTVYLEVEDVVVSPADATVFVNGRNTNLTKTEYRLFAYLICNSPLVLRYDWIFEAVWKNNDATGNPAVIRQHIHAVRKKLNGTHARNCIQFVRNVGAYKFLPTYKK